MPVSKERQQAYLGGSLKSPEWLALRHQILDRDGHACKRCRVPNHREIVRGIGGDKGFFMYADDSVSVPCDDGHLVFHDLQVHCENSGALIEISEPGLFAFDRRIKIVLTIAHLDHDVSNNDPSNLAALCQLHHNRHDAKYRAATRRMRRNGDLFLDVRAA